MAKVKTQYRCNECGYITTKWMGKCPECNTWGSLEEEMASSNDSSSNTVSWTERGEALRLGEISAQEGTRISTGFEECDRVLGGGIVLGSLILISGEPGIGKSTLLLQILGHLSNTGEVLYVSGEESPTQIKIRAERLNITSNNIIVMGETKILTVIEKIKEINPKLVIIDSIQTMMDRNLNSSAGSVSQIKQCTLLLLDLANNNNIPIFVVGHVTKDGEIAGPRLLEHMVDAQLIFEGDRQQQVRVLRTEKNRFGSTDEVGIFTMENEGLVEVKNPSELFLSQDEDMKSGSAIAVTMEGTRPILVEVQALVVPTTFNYPRRMSVGIDSNRLTIISAVLEKKLGLPLSRYDIYVNVVGGIKIKETSSDFAVAMAIASSLRDVPVGKKIAVVGELGLTGEIRSVPQIQQRVNEVKKLGWDKIIIPNQRLKEVEGIEVIKTKNMRQVFNQFFG